MLTTSQRWALGAAGVLTIPALTAVGFLTWGFHFALLDLGFWVMAPAQYLAAGVLVLAWSVPAFWGFLAGQLASIGRDARPPRAPKSARWWFALVGGPFAGFAVAGLLAYENRLLRSWFFFALFAVLLSSGYVAAATVSGPPFERTSSNANGERFRPRRFVALLAAVLLVTSFPVGFGALGLVPEAWGGAEPRDAMLVVDVDALDAATRLSLLPPSNSTTNQTLPHAARTAELEVLLHNDAWFFVYVFPHDGRPGQSYQISTQAVKLVIWKN